MEPFFQILFVPFQKRKITQKTDTGTSYVQSAEVKNQILQIVAKLTNLERKLVLVFLQLTEGLYFATFI